MELCHNYNSGIWRHKSGRIIASILMLVGIGFVGMLTGTIATYFLNDKKKDKTYKSEVI